MKRTLSTGCRWKNDFDSTAYLKIGQFQIPFGLLAVYDPHLLILQPLYAAVAGRPDRLRPGGLRPGLRLL